MRIAVISDIHGNATAFEAVWADIEKQEGIEGVYCLGDNIGYGPEPEKVIAMVREHGIPAVLGNHELAVKQPESLSWFNPNARRSLEKTMTMLSREAKDYIAELPTCISFDDCRFVHGFPPDSVTTYLFEIDTAGIKYTLDRMSERMIFIGHTHELVIIEYDGLTVNSEPLYKGTVQLDPQKKYIINVGSVGQPRDGSNPAKYVIYDDAANELTVRYVDYDINDTIEKIQQAGLPEQHGWRLL